MAKRGNNFLLPRHGRARLCTDRPFVPPIGSHRGRFRMKTSRTITNMMLFDREGKIKKYESAKEILEDLEQQAQNANLRLKRCEKVWHA